MALVEYNDSSASATPERGPKWPESECVLRDWYFLVVHPTIDVTVQGIRTDTNELWQTGVIKQRLNPRMFVTSSGTCYTLHGSPNTEHMEAVLKYKPQFVQLFRNGLPPKWHHWIKEYYANRCAFADALGKTSSRRQEVLSQSRLANRTTEQSHVIAAKQQLRRSPRVAREETENVPAVESRMKTPPPPTKAQPKIASPRMSAKALKHVARVTPARALHGATPTRRAVDVTATNETLVAGQPMGPAESTRLDDIGLPSSAVAPPRRSPRLSTIKELDNVSPIAATQKRRQDNATKERTPKTRRLVDYDESGIDDALEVKFGPHLPEPRCTLREWYFIVLHPTIEVTIQGRRTDTSELWQTDVVRQRLNARLFLTKTGSCYALEGPPDATHMKNVLKYKQQIIGLFRDGLPPKWREWLSEHEVSMAINSTLMATRVQRVLSGANKSRAVVEPPQTLTPPRIAVPRRSPRIEVRQRSIESPTSLMQQAHDVAPQQPVVAQEEVVVSSHTTSTSTQQKRAIVDYESEDITMDAWSTPETSSEYLPVRQRRVLESPPEEDSPQREVEVFEESRLETTAPQRVEMKKGTETTERLSKLPRQLEPVPEDDESDSSSAVTCDDPNCSLCQAECDDPNCAECQAAEAAEREHMSRLLADQELFDAEISPSQPPSSKGSKRQPFKVPKRPAPVLGRKRQNNRTVSFADQSSLPRSSKVNSRTVSFAKPPARQKKAPPKKRWTNEETKMLKIALDARNPQSESEWSAVAASVKRTVADCRKRANEVYNWDEIQAMKRYESEQREKAALARKQQEAALVTAKPGTMQYAQQTAKAAEMSLMRVQQTTTTYTFVPKASQSDANKALGGDSFVRAHDFMSAAPWVHSSADAERVEPIIEEVHDEEQPREVPQPSTSTADGTKNIDTNDSNDLFGDPSIGALYSDTVPPNMLTLGDDDEFSRTLATPPTRRGDGRRVAIPVPLSEQSTRTTSIEQTPLQSRDSVNEDTPVMQRRKHRHRKRALKLNPEQRDAERDRQARYAHQLKQDKFGARLNDNDKKIALHRRIAAERTNAEMLMQVTKATRQARRRHIDEMTRDFDEHQDTYAGDESEMSETEQTPVRDRRRRSSRR